MWPYMKKINEIFYSLQGEGFHAGTPSVFVRFSGCNLRCAFCDTDHREGVEMTDDEIVERVGKYPAEWIILTGGEPTLFIDDEFVRFLKTRTGKKIAIETNGTNIVPPSVDWITVSPKSGFQGGGEYEVKTERADELKVVEIGQDLDPYFKLKCVTPATRMYLQPCFVDNDEVCKNNRERTIRRVLSDPRWTLSVQLHRFLAIP